MADAVRLEALRRVYDETGSAVTALDGVTAGFAAGHVHRGDGTVRFRQEHAAAVRGRAGPADRGAGVHRRHGVDGHPARRR